MLTTSTSIILYRMLNAVDDFIATGMQMRMSRYKFIRCIKLALDAATVKVYTNKLKKEVLTAQVRADFR